MEGLSMEKLCTHTLLCVYLKFDYTIHFYTKKPVFIRRADMQASKSG